MRGLPREEVLLPILPVLLVLLGAAPARAESPPVELTLRRCAQLSLRASEAIALKKSWVHATKAFHERESGAFYPTVDGNVTFRRQVFGTPLEFEDRDGRYAETEPKADMGIRGVLPTGTRYDFRLSSSILWTTRTSSRLSPQNNANAEFMLAQPLLKGWGLGATVAEREATAIEHRVAKIEVGSAAEEVLRATVAAYWTLFAEQGVEATLERAQTVLERHLELSRRRRSSDAFLIETLLASQRQARAAAQTALLRAERALLLMIYLRGDEEADKLLNRRLRASERPRVGRQRRPLQQLIGSALHRRPDVRAARQRVRAQQTRADGARSRSKPRLDLEARLGTTGLVGITTFANPDYDVSEVPNRNILGRYGNAWQQVVKFELPYVLVGLRFELPLSSTVRTFEEKEALGILNGLKIKLRGLESRVAVQVRDAYFSVGQTGKRVTDAQRTLKSVQRRLAQLQQQYSRGAATNYDVLLALQAFVGARNELAWALRDFMVSRAELAYATGQLRDHLKLD